MIEVNVFSLSAMSSISKYETLLNDEEMGKSSRFRFDKHRSQFIVGKGYVRKRLGELMERDAKMLKFSFTTFGKPYIDRSRFFFNVSHSEDVVLIAISDEGEVGVDIEYKRGNIDLKKLAMRNFSPWEYELISSQDDERFCDGFYKVWTRKEAFIKAYGEGLSVPLDQFSVHPFDESSPLRRLKYKNLSAEDWWIQNLEVDGNYEGALCSHQKPVSQVVIVQHF